MGRSFPECETGCSLDRWGWGVSIVDPSHAFYSEYEFSLSYTILISR